MVTGHNIAALWNRLAVFEFNNIFFNTEEDSKMYMKKHPTFEASCIRKSRKINIVSLRSEMLAIILEKYAQERKKNNGNEMIISPSLAIIRNTRRLFGGVTVQDYLEATCEHTGDPKHRVPVKTIMDGLKAFDFPAFDSKQADLVVRQYLSSIGGLFNKARSRTAFNRLRNVFSGIKYDQKKSKTI